MARDITRRTMLRGMAGGMLTTLALPPLEAMFNASGTAYADGSDIPRRLGFWFWGNGVRPDRWKPSGTGRNWELSEELQPLRGVKDQLSVLTGFEMKHSGTAHHVGRAGILTGTYDADSGRYGNPTGPSIPYIARKQFEGETPHASIDVGISVRGKSNSRPDHGVVINENGDFVSIDRSPRSVFERFFTDGVPDQQDAERAKARKALRGSALDALLEDSKDLKKELGANDRRRIDKHMEAFRALERRLDGYEERTCKQPEGDIGGADEYGDFGREDLIAKNEIMSDLVVMALACDLTRVASVTFTTMQSDVVFWQIGATEGSHVMTHDDRGLEEKLEPQFERVHKSVVFMMERYAYLLNALDNVQEGDGTLLDHTVFIASSEVNDGTRHNYNDMPLLVAGGANGKLKTGQHIASQNAENTSKVMLTCMKAAGIDVDRFGTGEGLATDTLGALEA